MRYSYRLIRQIVRYCYYALQNHCVDLQWHSYVNVDGQHWVHLKLGNHMWHDEFTADPFLFHWKGLNWCFYETMGKDKKGKIGCFKEVDGKWIQQGIVLEQPWHLSYPQVFDEGGHVYMIPEESDFGRGSVNLYEALDFPKGWAKRATLINRPFADSTLLVRDGHYYLACYTIPPHETAELWHAPTLTGPWSRHPQSGNMNQSNRLRRCGGAFVEEDGRLFRIVQDSNGFYGKRLFKVEVTSISPETYREGRVSLLLDKTTWPYCFKHTYNEITVKGKKFFVIDCRERHFKSFGTCVHNILSKIVKKIRLQGKKLAT